MIIGERQNQFSTFLQNIYNFLSYLIPDNVMPMNQEFVGLYLQSFLLVVSCYLYNYLIEKRRWEEQKNNNNWQLKYHIIHVYGM